MVVAALVIPWILVALDLILGFLNLAELRRSGSRPGNEIVRIALIGLE